MTRKKSTTRDKGASKGALADLHKNKQINNYQGLASAGAGAFNKKLERRVAVGHNRLHVLAQAHGVQRVVAKGAPNKKRATDEFDEKKKKGGGGREEEERKKERKKKNKKKRK